MPRNHYQASLFDSQTHVLKLFEADIEYLSDFIESKAGWRLYQQLLQQTEWRQDRLTVYGKALDELLVL